MSNIEWRMTNSRGRGIFALDDIAQGTILEVCPVIVIPKRELQKIHESVLYNYYYLWGDKQDRGAIVLGYGMLYNHSPNPNVDYEPDYRKKKMAFFALRNVIQGEELRINYNGAPDDKSMINFHSKQKRSWRGYRVNSNGSITEL